MLHKIDDLRIDPCPVPEPDEHEVLLKMDSVGICGSDVHYWKSGMVTNTMHLGVVCDATFSLKLHRLL